MILLAFTIFHVLLSLAAIVAGFGVCGHRSCIWRDFFFCGIFLSGCIRTEEAL